MDRQTGEFGSFKSQQAAAFSCLSCGAAFATVEDLEQHELNCGVEAPGAASGNQDALEPDEDDGGNA